jgi:hypothetical protein
MRQRQINLPEIFSGTSEMTQKPTT